MQDTLLKENEIPFNGLSLSIAPFQRHYQHNFTCLSTGFRSIFTLVCAEFADAESSLFEDACCTSCDSSNTMAFLMNFICSSLGTSITAHVSPFSSLSSNPRKLSNSTPPATSPTASFILGLLILILLNFTFSGSLPIFLNSLRTISTDPSDGFPET
ncbi:hypothetical protein V8G54_001275 [Vigna mungo]|uniref:Uncharacterized protein n=1 Tax=Vigna mungo TaxID=3915 RepID=A0AAQ3P812_VIGMU